MKIRVLQLFVILKYILALLFTAFHKKELWVISERGAEARDNGYVFFKFMKEKHPEVNCVYIMDKNNKDYPKLKQYDNAIIQNKSFKHYLCVARSTKLISTHYLGFLPHPYFFQKLNAKYNIFRNKKKVFLQHGIIKDNLPGLYSESTRINIFICGSKYEYDYVSKHFHYKHNEVKYTGLARFDYLLNTKPKKQILVMPTWRKYINKSDFIESDYFIHYKELLTNTKLHNIIESNGYELMFYPHYEVQKHIYLFKNLNLPPFIKICDFSSDVQQLLIDASLLITDYSSVYFDVIYMQKPVLLYQFDEDDYRKMHYAEGYFNVEDIGRKSKDIDSLIRDLEFQFSIGLKIEDKYKDYISGMYLFHDTDNCKRIYNVIK